MKIKRQKKVGKILSFFKNNYGHREPFQVLIDGTFTQACLGMKVNIKDQLPKYLGDIKLLTTKCCIEECDKLNLYGANLILKQFSIHKCQHEEGFRPAMKCLKSMIGAENTCRYFVATQDPQLREKCRKIAGTPLLYLHHCAPVLEKPSEMSENQAQNTVENRMLSEQARLASLKKQLGILQEEQGINKRKRAMKKGNPNPLSCLKSKKKSSDDQTLRKVQDKMQSEAGKKRKRIRIRKKNKAIKE